MTYADLQILILTGHSLEATPAVRAYLQAHGLLNQADLAEWEPTALTPPDGIPDLTTIDAAESSPDEIRGLIPTLHTPPARSKVRVLILQQPQHLHPNAQAVLLKTLEEPPRHLRVFLVAYMKDAVIPTVRSRANDFPPRMTRKLTHTQLTAHLTKQGNTEPAWRAQASINLPDYADKLDPLLTKRFAETASLVVTGQAPPPDYPVTWSRAIKSSDHPRANALVCTDLFITTFASFVRNHPATTPLTIRSAIKALHTRTRLERDTAKSVPEPMLNSLFVDQYSAAQAAAAEGKPV